MCGILGHFVKRGVIKNFETLCAATESLKHRGPDDGAWWSEGRFFLGHRRLSIIDVARGSQPMATYDGLYVIVFNGEIYNYLELREELIRNGCVFKSDSDTEVILEGYRLWGTDLPKRLAGMFAFAIVDRFEESLYLARDRFGEKPLFIHENDDTVSFASELGALAALPSVPRAVDSTALAEFLCLNYVPGERTLMQGVHRLPIASWRLYSRSKTKQEVYWSPPKQMSDDHHGMEFNDAVDGLRGVLDESISIVLRSDVPVALFLSGGIDSSVIAESAVRQGRIQHAYCLDMVEQSFSEFPHAYTVAKSIGIELRRVPFSADEMVNFFDVVKHADDPLADSSALAVWALSRKTALDYKVVISGDGGDELFGGYLTYKATAYHRMLTTMLPWFVLRGLAEFADRFPISAHKVSKSYKLMRFLRAADLPSNIAHFTWNGSWLPEMAQRLIRDPDHAQQAEKVFDKIADRYALSSVPGLDDLQRVDTSEYLPNDILAKVDRMSMAHGLEVRSPFLVPSVAEYAFKLPGKFKMTLLGKSKRILRHLATVLYGSRIGHAKKQGFSIPVHHWLRGKARPFIEELLTKDRLEDMGLLDTQAVLKAKRCHMKGQAQLGFELWGLMVLVAWHHEKIQCQTAFKKDFTLRRVRFPFTT